MTVYVVIWLALFAAVAVAVMVVAFAGSDIVTWYHRKTYKGRRRRVGASHAE